MWCPRIKTLPKAQRTQGLSSAYQSKSQRWNVWGSQWSEGLCKQGANSDWCACVRPALLVHICGFWITFNIASTSPFGNIAIGATTDELQGRERKAQTRAADFGPQFFGFWITFDIAYRSLFGIFAIGATTDELQVRARKAHTVSDARAQMSYRADFYRTQVRS